MTESVKSYCADLKHSGGRDTIFSIFLLLNLGLFALMAGKGYFIWPSSSLRPHTSNAGERVQKALVGNKDPTCPHASKAFFLMAGKNAKIEKRPSLKTSTLKQEMQIEG